MGRHGELEGGTGTGLRLRPDPSAVAFDDLFADGQADAIARVFAAGVQTLEDDKDVFRVLRGNSDSVIAHAEQPVLARLFRLRGNYGRLFPAELEGVSDQILEDLRHLRAVRPHRRKLT